LSALNCWQELEVYALPARAGTGAAIMPPPAETIEAAAVAVVPANEVQAVATAAAGFESARAAALPPMAQLTRTPPPTHPVPASVNVAATANAQATLESARTGEAPATTGARTPAVAALNWATVFLAGLMLIVILGLLHALVRAMHALAHARSK
jgi:hypothetical protein